MLHIHLFKQKLHLYKTNNLVKAICCGFSHLFHIFFLHKFSRENDWFLIYGKTQDGILCHLCLKSIHNL